MYTDTGEAKPGISRRLQRLKNTCENRSGIRAVYLEVLDLMETPRDNSHPFKRFVECVRTHLFNLSTIGERVYNDTIELIALKLQLRSIGTEAKQLELHLVFDAAAKSRGK